MGKIGVVLGSGLGGVAARIQAQETIPMEKIMGDALKGKTAPLGHNRRLILGKWKGKELALLQGRLHYYEGLPMPVVVEPIRYFKSIGVDTVILSFAGGGANPKWRAGDFAVLTDHIHHQSANPLHGSTQFVDCTHVYDPQCVKNLLALAKKKKIRAHPAVYMSFDGPSYETPAEIRAMRALGADVAGMSVTAEAITARSLGMRVVGLGWASNMAAGVAKHALSHKEVLEMGAKVEKPFADLLLSFIETL